MALSYASFSAIVSLSVIQSPLIKKNEEGFDFFLRWRSGEGVAKAGRRVETLDVIIHDILYLGYIYQV